MQKMSDAKEFSDFQSDESSDDDLGLLLNADQDVCEESNSNGLDENGYNTIKCEPSSPNVRVFEQPNLLAEAIYSLGETPTQDPVIIKPARNPITTDDEFDTSGKNYANKLRGMSQQQRIIAEKIMSDIMYHGQMEMLTLQSHLELNK